MNNSGENIWNEYSNEYSWVESFPPKEKHDEEIAFLVKDLLERDGLERDEINVAEVGAGFAPISKRLEKEGYNCKAFDANPEMTSKEEGGFVYDKNFDLTRPEISEEEKGKYDVVVMENAWYATTLSPEGTRKYTEDEAKLMRLTSLKKASALLRPGGFLVISDPLKSTEGFGLKNIYSFLQLDKEARRELYNENKSIPQIVIQYLKDPRVKEVFKRNKDIMKKAVLMEEKEVDEMIEASGLFDEVVCKEPNTYLGDNITMALRRNGLELEGNEKAKLGETVVLEGHVHEEILDWIGDFRRKIYARSKTQTNLPKVDKFDLKKGVLVTFFGKDRLGLSAAGTLQPVGETGLELEELMYLEKNGGFYNFLSETLAKKSPAIRKKLDSGEEISYAEVRRLAMDNLGLEGSKKCLKTFSSCLREYCSKEGVDVVLFISDEKKAKMFNAFVDENFVKAGDFHLNREDENSQTVMLTGADYFLKDWRSYLEEEEVGLMGELQKLLVNGRPWRKVIENHPMKSEIESTVQKLFANAPENVFLYAADLSATKK